MCAFRVLCFLLPLMECFTVRFAMDFSAFSTIGILNSITAFSIHCLPIIYITDGGMGEQSL